ncbi:hypothetical protein Tco_0204873 [Tanacetum coccineum]
MVACLERTYGNVAFHKIVDFLTTSPIYYALTVSPTIYASYIEQFWNTAHSQTVNDVKQIHATVDGKTVVISESSVRNDLHFNDEDGVTYEAVFQEWDDRVMRATTTAASLDATQASGNITKTQSTTMSNDPLSQEIGSRGHTPGSDEGRLQQEKLTDIVTALSQKVEGLESDLKKTKKLYATAFNKLINKVKSLEDELKFQKSKSKRRRLTLVTSEDEEDLVAEDPSKQGRSLIEEMDLDAGISLVSPHVEVRGRYGQNLETQEDTPADDLTLAETLMEIRKSAAKDKGKAKMDETKSPRKMKQKEWAQISRDEEVAQKLQEEFDAAERQRMA